MTPKKPGNWDAYGRFALPLVANLAGFGQALSRAPGIRARRLYERGRHAARIREWQTLLASAVKSDKRVSMFGGTDDFQTAIATLLTAVDRRRSLIEAALGR